MTYTETATATHYMRIRPMDHDALLDLPAFALQAKLTAGDITSVDLVTACLARIDRYNARLNCLISIRPREQLLAQAAALDAERRSSSSSSSPCPRLRSPLHGLPVVLKDAIVTSPELGMPTTAGAAVFARMTARRSAPLVDRLLAAGLIVLAKANMTELCGLKSNNVPAGWSAVGGQTLSPYRRRGGALADADQPTAAGSSSGPAVAVAAGFAPLAVGTETSGALVYPASVCGVYAHKCAYGSVPMGGVFCVSASYDCVGAVARHPRDVAALVEVLQGRPGLGTRVGGARGAEGDEFRGLAVGVVASTWGVHESIVAGKWGDARVIKQYENAVSKMRSHGGRVVYPLQAPEPDVIRYDGETLVSTSYGEFSDQIKEFIHCFQYSGVRDLRDIISWNNAHASTALPPPYSTQTELIAAANSRMRPEMLRALVPRIRHLAGPNGMGEVMRRSGGLDIVLSSSECQLVTYAAAAGWPVATVPLGHWCRNGQPYGMFALAREGDEELLLRFAAAWESVFGAVVERPDLEGMP